MSTPPSLDARKVQEQYERRRALPAGMYSPLQPWMICTLQERERAIAALLRRIGMEPLRERRLLEIGCGYGDNLLFFLRLGFAPENLAGNELLDERVEAARRRLPAATSVYAGDAAELGLPPESFDIVYQSMVFTSILDDDFQRRVAETAWSLVRPGGGVLWYDFTFDNPRNPDVRGVSLARVRELFPEGRVQSRRVTLAPPLARRVAAIHPALYSLFVSLPFLRTHVLCWIEKPAP
jgi:SAM-dependent methyltransferase